MKKIIPIFLLSFVLLTNTYAREIITGTKNEKGDTVLDKKGIVILNEELRQYNEDIKDNASDILWESDGGDIELKTANDLDMQNKEIKGFIIENRTNDTGCTQTGRLWIRTD